MLFVGHFRVCLQDEYLSDDVPQQHGGQASHEDGASDA